MSNSHQTTTGADAIDTAIAAGIDCDRTAILTKKLELYHRVMGLERQQQRSRVSNAMRSRSGASHLNHKILTL